MTVVVVARKFALLKYKRRVAPPPSSVIRLPPSMVVSLLVGSVTCACSVMVTGAAPQLKVMAPPLATAARKLASVQPLGSPLPTTVALAVEAAANGGVQVAAGATEPSTPPLLIARSPLPPIARSPPLETARSSPPPPPSLPESVDFPQDRRSAIPPRSAIGRHDTDLTTSRERDQGRGKIFSTGMFDSHCHLHDSRIADPAPLLTRARAAGVSGFLLAGVEPDGWEAERRITAAHPDVSMALGVHPQLVAEVDDADPLVAQLDAALAGASAVGRSASTAWIIAAPACRGRSARFALSSRSPVRAICRWCCTCCAPIRACSRFLQVRRAAAGRRSAA